MVMTLTDHSIAAPPAVRSEPNGQIKHRAPCGSAADIARIHCEDQSGRDPSDHAAARSSHATMKLIHRSRRRRRCGRWRSAALLEPVDQLALLPPAAALAAGHVGVHFSIRGSGILRGWCNAGGVNPLHRSGMTGNGRQQRCLRQRRQQWSGPDTSWLLSLFLSPRYQRRCRPRGVPNA